MRVKAPFPILPVLFGFVFALSLPLMLAATPLAVRYVPTTLRRSAPAAAQSADHKNAHKDELRAGVKTHKAQRSAAAKAASKRNKRPAGTRKQSKSKPHGVRLQESPADRETSRRVHAWVEGGERPESGVKKPSATSDIADARMNSADGTAAGPDAAKPESVISTIRTSTDKPQLPPVEELAAEPVILPSLYNKRGRLVVPPPLKGSHEILVHQNQVANDEGLDRIHDDADLERMRRAGVLVAIPAGSTLRIDDRLTPNRRYCRPWTALFLDTLARQHYARFQTALQVNSAVRTVEFQQHLVHTNGNAAPAEGDTASPHLTGQAVDIAKRGLSMTEIAWLRGYLLPLVQQGKIDVEEEFQQSCFHISVYKSYMPQGQTNRRIIATTHREGMGSLGMAVR